MTDWRSIHEAAAILATFATILPESRVGPYEGLTCHHRRFYFGARVRKLTAIHRAEATRLLAECDASGDRAAFIAHCDLDVQSAIRDIIKSAESFRALGQKARAA